jgi:hypothetical protein
MNAFVPAGQRLKTSQEWGNRDYPPKALVPQVHSFADCANDESREPPVQEGGRLDSKDPEHASPAGDAAPGIGICAEHRNLAHNREP